MIYLLYSIRCHAMFHRENNLYRQQSPQSKQSRLGQVTYLLTSHTSTLYFAVYLPVVMIPKSSYYNILISVTYNIIYTHLPPRISILFLIVGLQTRYLLFLVLPISSILRTVRILIPLYVQCLLLNFCPMGPKTFQHIRNEMLPHQKYIYIYIYICIAPPAISNEQQ